jgi:lipopolysaccharide heptosyltransferase II
VVQALPVLRHIKHHRPASEVYWWIDSNLTPLLAGDPGLAGLIPFHRRGWVKPENWLRLYRQIRWLRAQAFDWVIDLQCLARSGAFAWLVNGRRLIGLDEVREGGRGFYDVVARRPCFHTHAVDWYLRVLPLLGVPRHEPFDWLPVRPEVAAAIRQKWPIGNAPWVLLQPGARWLNKRWPVEHFAELARDLASGFPQIRLAILGGAEDRSLGEAIGRGVPRSLDLTGRLTLPEMVEWIRVGALMITNDTGPMHVAAALGKPVVGLFGPTEPCRTGPYGQMDAVLQLDLPCVPCLSSRCGHRRRFECLVGLSPAAVLRQVRPRLERALNPDSSATG